MKKYILAIRHFVPHLIGVVAFAVVAYFLGLDPVTAIIVNTFFTLLLPYMEKVKEVGQQLEREREEQEHLASSVGTMAGTAPERRRTTTRPSAPTVSGPPPSLKTKAKTSRVAAPASGLLFIAPALKGAAFLFVILVVTGLSVYAIIYLLLYFFFYP